MDHPQAVEAYEMWHRPGKTPAEVIEFFRRHGVEDLRIHRAGNRLFMTLDLSDDLALVRATQHFHLLHELRRLFRPGRVEDRSRFADGLSRAGLPK